MAGYLYGIARDHVRRMLERNRSYVAREYNSVQPRNAAVRFAEDRLRRRRGPSGRAYGNGTVAIEP